MAISQNFPAIAPTLSLNFTRSKTLDPRITFSRPSAATRVSEDGMLETVIADRPRFNHTYNSSNGTVKSLGLLVEERRTNFILYSRSFESGWFHNDPTVGSGYATQIIENTPETLSPDGTYNAAKIIQANNGWQRILQGVTTSTNNRHTFSIFVKKGNSNQCVIECTGNFNAGGRIRWNFDTETFSDYSPVNWSNLQFTKFPNQWYRLSGDFLATSASGTSGAVWFFPGLDYQGVPASPAAYTYVYGFQLEEGPFPTSYIPTQASTVTRSGDLAFIKLPSTGWYNYAQGSLLLEHSTVPYGPGINPGYPSIGFAHANGTSQSAIMYFFVKTNGSAQYLVRDEFIDQSGMSVSGAPSAKVGFTYATNAFVLVRNGTQVATDNSGVVPQLIGSLVLGINDNNPALSLNACIGNVVYYPRALSSSQLQSLTK